MATSSHPRVCSQLYNSTVLLRSIKAILRKLASRATGTRIGSRITTAKARQQADHHMPHHEPWQLEGTAAELYERYLVPAITALWAADLVERVAPAPVCCARCKESS